MSVASSASTQNQLDPNRWRALMVIAIAQLMVVLDASIVNIALPSIQADLGITDANRQWVVTAYTLAFGGLLACFCLLSHQDAWLLGVGLLYVVEALSVVLQVGYFKLTKGKRLFKMAPLHHHFELVGWKETTVVRVFVWVNCLVGLGCLLLKVYN
jgi:MFS family permease